MAYKTGSHHDYHFGSGVREGASGGPLIMVSYRSKMIQTDAVVMMLTIPPVGVYVIRIWASLRCHLGCSKYRALRRRGTS